MKARVWLILGLLVPALVLGACSPAPSPSPTPSPTPTPTPTPSPTTPPAGATFGQLAQQGQTVYAGRCAGCHGDRGQGGRAPALIGSGANLGKFQTADGLIRYISLTMPANSPGTLTQADYQSVLCYLLVQNNFASTQTSFNASGLTNLSLAR